MSRLRRAARTPSPDTVGDQPALRPLTTLVALIAVSNVVTTRLPDALYVPLKLASAAACLGLARRGGADLADLGLRPQDAPRSGALGALAAGAVTGAITWGGTTPAGRDVMASMAPAGDGTSVRAAALVRIPLGTALAEELMFRSALLGLLLRTRSPRRAVAWSSLLFGLWHVLPTAAAYSSGRTYGRAAAPLGVAGHVLTAVGVTTAAGQVLAWLRLRSGSVVAPVLVHTAANSVGLLGARAVVG